MSYSDRSRSSSRKRNKSSPLVENSPKKTKQNIYQQLQHEPEGHFSTDSESERNPIDDSQGSPNQDSKTILHSPDITSTPIISSRSAMESPDLSQSQSLLGGLVQHEPHPGQLHPHSNHNDTFGPSQPPFLNPMMVQSPMNPGLLAYQGLPPGVMAPAPGLSEQDIIKIATVIKQLVIDDIKEMVTTKVELATQSLKTELNSVKDRCSSLEKEVSALKVKNDDIEQYSRRMCLRIGGIKEQRNENVTQRVLDFADNLNVSLSPDDIDRAHRVGKRADSGGATSSDDGNEDEQNTSVIPGRSREIIIKFTNSSARLKLLQGRSKLRENKIKDIFINEDLTPARKELAYECRQLKRSQKSKVSRTWVYAGYPHILDKSGNRVKITCMSDLDDYRDKKPDSSEPMATI